MERVEVQARAFVRPVRAAMRTPLPPLRDGEIFARRRPRVPLAGLRLGSLHPWLHTGAPPGRKRHAALRAPSLTLAVRDGDWLQRALPRCDL